MLDIREKSKMRRILYSKPTIVAMIATCAFLANSAWGMYQKSVVSTSKKVVAETDLAELESRERTLSKDIVNLSTERGMDEQIRERFMVAKEGENVLIIANPGTKEIHTVTVPDTH